MRNGKRSSERGSLSVGLLIGLFVLGALILTVAWAWGSLGSWKDQGVGLETTASAQYSDAQNYLSNYSAGFYESCGIVKYKSDKIDQIVSNYVQGRSMAKSGQTEQAAFVNAVVEAVPDVGKLDIADKMLDYVAAGREGFRNKQTALRDTTRSYEAFLTKGLLRPWILKTFLGFPRPTLKAQIGENIVTGEAALNKMNALIITADTKKAYESGVMEPLSAPTAK